MIGGSRTLALKQLKIFNGRKYYEKIDGNIIIHCIDI